tara:strand:- start:5391 stop:5798 length:408 start_codon:yes stop_codon:yes gene_type:complete
MNNLKAWGQTDRVVLTDSIQVEQITVQPGGYCSIHYHNYKDNFFMVLSGILTVRWGWRENAIVTAQVPPQIEQLSALSSGLQIPAGVLHQFENLSDKPVRAVELYRTKPGYTLKPDDIIRFNRGGRHVGNGNGGR